MISNIPETDPIEHVRWRICISTLGKSFSDIAIDLNFLQRTMNRNQLSAAIIRITLKLFFRMINLRARSDISSSLLRTVRFRGFRILKWTAIINTP